MTAFNNIDKADFICFTDGSSLGNPGGSGAAAITRGPNNNSWTINKQAIGIANNNIAELWAIWLAISTIAKSNIPPPFIKPTVNIFSDSKYAIKTLQGKCKSKVNMDLIAWVQNELDKLKQNYIIKWYWVPGHCGIEYNEIVDKLAKERASYAQNIAHIVWKSDTRPREYHEPEEKELVIQQGITPIFKDKI